MTIAEILKANGITDDVITKIQEEMKASKIFTASEENLDIRYGKLKTDHEGVTKQLGEANSLIEELKKSNKGNEGLQQQITDYEGQVKQLQEELAQAKLDSAINTGLLAAGVKPDDIDYVAFKLKAKGDLTLDENDKIKGWDDKLAGLKTQLPTHFESAGGDDGGYKVFDPNKLKNGSGSDITPTKESFQAMSYEQRLALKQKNEELYKQLAK